MAAPTAGRMAAAAAGRQRQHRQHATTSTAAEPTPGLRHGGRDYRWHPCSTVQAMADLALAGYAERERERILDTLFSWLRIPSISADPDHAADVRASAEFCAELLPRGRPRDTWRFSRPAAAPAVYGDWLHAGPAAPTVLVYGHHDVQPVDPLEEWTSPPFDPVIVDGECRARGAIDDKGQTLYQIEAARGLLAERGACRSTSSC